MQKNLRDTGIECPGDIGPVWRQVILAALWIICSWNIWNKYLSKILAPGNTKSPMSIEYFKKSCVANCLQIFNLRRHFPNQFNEVKTSSYMDITSDLNFNAFIPNCSGIQVQQHTHVGQKVQTGSFNWVSLNLESWVSLNLYLNLSIECLWILGVFQLSAFESLYVPVWNQS